MIGVVQPVRSTRLQSFRPFDHQNGSHLKHPKKGHLEEPRLFPNIGSIEPSELAKVNPNQNRPEQFDEDTEVQSECNASGT